MGDAVIPVITGPRHSLRLSVPHPPGCGPLRSGLRCPFYLPPPPTGILSSYIAASEAEQRSRHRSVRCGRLRLPGLRRARVTTHITLNHERVHAHIEIGVHSEGGGERAHKRLKHSKYCRLCRCSFQHHRNMPRLGSVIYSGLH